MNIVGNNAASGSWTNQGWSNTCGINFNGTNIFNPSQNSGAFNVTYDVTSSINGGNTLFEVYTNFSSGTITLTSITLSVKSSGNLGGNLNVEGRATFTDAANLGGNLYLRVYSLAVTMPANGGSNNYTVPSGVTGSNVKSISGVIYTGSVTYPIGLTQDTNYNSRVWMSGTSNLVVQALGIAVANCSATFTFIVSS